LDHVKNISQGEWVPKWSIKYKKYEDGVEQYLKVTLIGFVKVEAQQGDPTKPMSYIDVLHASSRLDIFRETTFYPSPTSVIIEANTVYIEYDKSGKIKQMNGFKTTQKVIIYENKGIWGDKEFGELSISPAMKGFIYEVENSVYHCLGCRQEQSGIDKWWDFIWSKPEERKNRLNINSGAPHR